MSKYDVKILPPAKKYVIFMYILRIYFHVVNLTISLSDETVQRLRRAINDYYGNKKGAISGLIEQSLRDKLDDIELPSPAQTFRAVRNGHAIAEADNLSSLTQKLEQLKVDPRSVRITSSRKLSPVVRLGPRGRSRSSSS